MRTRVARWAPVVVVPTMVLALAGCSGDDGDDEPGRDETSAATAATETTPPPQFSPPLPTPPTLTRTEGGLADVDWDEKSCSLKPGTRAVEGTLTNPTKKPLDYVVTISWTTDTSNTLGLGFATVRQAKPGVKTPWELRGKVPVGVSKCVINVLRGRLAG